MVMQSSQSRKNMFRSKLQFTKDDSMMFINPHEKRMDKPHYVDATQFLIAGTQNSCWTPINHRPSNQQFDMWTDCQRHQFFDLVFSRCNKSQYLFVQNWFDEQVPLQHLDFTRVLPRFLSLYIFSFLEPKSLSRAAQVCWTWKFLTEQDIIWMPKCLMRGWFLPYTPPDNEYGAWKKHYVFCVGHLDYVVLSKKNEIYGNKGDENDLKADRLKSKLFYETDSFDISPRPPWKGPDMKPKDLEKAFYAFVYGHSPSTSKMARSVSAIRSHWGTVSRKRKSYLTRSLDWNQTKSSMENDRQQISSFEEMNPQLDISHPCFLLSEIQALENRNEMRLRQLVDQPWEFKRELAYGISAKRTNDLKDTSSLGAKISENTSRIILISSRVPAAELLLAAVKFNVVPIVYEFEANTVDSLHLLVENLLDKNYVRSIGLICHEEDPGVINLVEGCQVSAQNFHSEPNVKQFFISLSSHILPVEQGGSFDIFSPLAASEDGMNLIANLTTTTGIKFSSPTSIVENYRKVLGKWLYSSEQKGNCPSLDYFCENKLNAWAHTAKHTTEAIKHCKNALSPFLKQFHNDLVAHITGEVIFDVMGRTFIYNLNKIIPALVEGLCLLGQQKHVNYMEFLSMFFHKKSQSEPRKMNHEVGETTPVTDPYDEEVANINGAKLLDNMDGLTTPREDILKSPVIIFTDTCPKSLLTQKEIKPVQSKSPGAKNKEIFSQLENCQKFYGTIVTQRLQRVSAEDFTAQPDKRTCVGMEILSSEMDFVLLLSGLKAVFFKPLSAALDSNRAIISLQNVEIIFTDILTIHKVHKELSENLKNRFADWNGITSCIGDIFVKFSAILQAHVNLVNNCDAILRCIERAKESMPAFRAFLCRHLRRPEVKMMTLQEVLFSPFERIREYVTLLSWFQVYTPYNHPDRGDLSSVIDSFTQLNNYVSQTKLRLQREEELVRLRREILNCPVLLEGNRHFLKQQDVFLVQPMSSAVAPELRVYQRTEIVGFYLFNDVLLVTRRTSRHRPFSLAIDYTYSFVCSLQLPSIRVKNIANSRYVTNAFKLASPSKKFYCCTDSYMEKVQWLSLLQQTIRAVSSS